MSDSFLNSYIFLSRIISHKSEGQFPENGQRSTWVVTPCEVQTVGSLCEQSQKGSRSEVMIVRYLE